MKAAVFVKPYEVQTIDKPKPKLSSADDVIVKVKYSGLCGSDLHYYRGHIPLKEGQTMGHEFVGTVVEKGANVSDDIFKIGDDVISTFTVQCGECWFCKHGHSGTCKLTNTFGKVGLEGAQAEYVLVPFAKSTLVKKPPNDNLSDSLYVLMADIFVTGYFGVKKIVDFMALDGFQPSDLNVLQFGAGPVGLCAVRIMKELGFRQIVVVDGIDDRLKEARRLGATDIVNFTTETLDLTKYTQGLGFDAVLEAVGAQSSMKLAFDSLRQGGFIASVGMGHDPLPFDGLQAYVKGLTVSFGRCNAWSLFGEVLEMFEKIKDSFEDFVEEMPPIAEAGEWYQRFERGEVKKVVFKF